MFPALHKSALFFDLLCSYGNLPLLRHILGKRLLGRFNTQKRQVTVHHLPENLMNDYGNGHEALQYFHDNYRFRVYIANILSLLLLIVSQDDVHLH
jgi:hypothetical protein